MVLPGKHMGWKEFFRAVKHEWKTDDVGAVAGSVTFFGVLALFPFMLFLVSLASLIIDPMTARALVDELGAVAPPQVTQILGGQLESLGQKSNPGLLTVGAIGAIWAASGGVAALMHALNRAYDVEERRPFWKVRGIALLSTLVAAALSLTAVLVAVALPALGSLLGGPWETAINLLRLPVAGLLMMLLWALLYYFLPDVDQRFSFITPGSLIGVVIWVLASWGFSTYVSNFGKYEATYGAIGGVIVLLLWMWISAQVLLLGAEINAILEHRSKEGKRQGAKSQDDQGASPQKGSPEAEPSTGPGHGPQQPSRGPAQAQPGMALARTPSATVAPPTSAPGRRGGRLSLGSLAAGVGLGVLVARRLAR